MININNLMRIDTHNHSHYSNFRLIDAISKPKDMILTAHKLGLKGLALTDHETVAGHIEWLQLEKELKQKELIPQDFKCILGNEIYLTDTREHAQTYYHYILLAKDTKGAEQLRKLSSIAWINSYTYKKMERVPTLKSELEEIVKKDPGHLIAQTACLGGELANLVLELVAAEKKKDEDYIYEIKSKINDFILWNISLFKDDFYIEIAPSAAPNQVTFNKRVRSIAKAYNLKIVPACDSHYLLEKDRYVHKAYLQSKKGEREVDEYYSYAHMMDNEECFQNLAVANYTEEDFKKLCENTMEIANKIGTYNLFHNPIIPEVEVKYYEKIDFSMSNYSTLKYLFNSDNIQERYWVNECWKGLKEKEISFNNFEKYVERLEKEADIIKTVGDKLGNCLFSYFNTFQHYIDLFWECGSISGPGRGSSVCFLSNYLLGITQLDPIEWDLMEWRFLNKERLELPDIDTDLSPSKRQKIFQAIREERGELNLLQVCTYGTEGTRSAILAAARGYRSEDYPDGIDVDDAQYLTSLVPQERGFLWSINDVINGNPEKGRRPVGAFIKEIEKYPGLLDIIQGISGIVNKRGIHASGVMMYNNSPFETNAIMKAPNGSLITQYDLHHSEAAGDTKFDYLVTEICDKIVIAIDLLKEDGYFKECNSLKEIYEKYFHPSVLNYQNPKLWSALAEGSVQDVFQFSTDVGLHTAKVIKPTNPTELVSANALMRLMAEEGQERPLDRYVRIKNDINLWYKEMDDFGLSKEEQKYLEKYYLNQYGTPCAQEDLMLVCMDEKIGNFSLSEANGARKIVAKKQMDKIPELREKFINQCPNPILGRYVWQTVMNPQMGYSFARPHALAYSFVALQTLEIAVMYPQIYWNTACLIVNSGAADEENGGSTNYGKNAKAIGNMRDKGINISLPNINSSTYGFKPDVENNQILYGLKAMLNVGDDVIENTIKNRPYSSIKDYYYRVRPNKRAMISLIKGGAFDSLIKRKKAMVWFIWETCDKKNRLTLQNMASLIKYNLLPDYDEEFITARRVYEFNRYLKAICKKESYYLLDERAINFLLEMGQDNLINNTLTLDAKVWDKIYQKWMDIFRSWIQNNKEQILSELNSLIFMEDWVTYAQGNYSSWEMEALCFYYHEHELTNVNKAKYGIENFYDLSKYPIVERTFKKGLNTINLYKLDMIVGTVIDKNKNKGTVVLLTTDGVVNVRFGKEYMAIYDRQLFEIQADGTKKVVEKSWFQRGAMIAVQGIRRDDEFVCKKYASSTRERIYKIDEIKENGDLILRHNRTGGENIV